jgi:trehalose 6-phosphate synthase/phosphatase
MAITPFIQAHTPSSAANVTRNNDNVPLADVLEQVRKLENEHRAKGIPLSGRIVHVTHYLPVTCTLATRAASGVLSPPATPPQKPADVADVPQSETTTLGATSSSQQTSPTQAKWLVNARWGHSAMISGIQSLGKTHSQVIVGWTGDLGGDIHSVGNSPPLPSEKDKSRIPLKDVTAEERTELEKELERYKLAAADGTDFDENETKGTQLIPVWLEDKTAHGHYDGYCKTSCVIPLLLIRIHSQSC